MSPRKMRTQKTLMMMVKGSVERSSQASYPNTTAIPAITYAAMMQKQTRPYHTSKDGMMGSSDYLERKKKSDIS
jgi:hypothetical protein